MPYYMMPEKLTLFDLFILGYKINKDEARQNYPYISIWIIFNKI